MEAVEAAVAHHQYVVSGPDEAGDLGDEGFYVGADPGARPERLRKRPVEAPRVERERLVGGGEARPEGVAVDPAAHGVGARLDHGHDPRRAPRPGAERRDGRADRGRVVREVVVDRDPAGGPDGLETPFDAAEVAERRRSFREVHAGRAGGREGGGRVVQVVLAGEPPLDLDPPFAPALGRADLEAGSVRRECVRRERAACAGVGAAPGSGVASGGGVASDPDHLRPASHGEHPLHLGAARDDAPARGNGADEVVELPFDGREVVEDVRVVVLEVVDDEGARAVVDELGALVEERGVVLVGLDDEVLARAQPARRAEVRRGAPDEPAGAPPRAFEDPGDEARHGGLAVGARDRDHVAAEEGVAGEPRRAGLVVEPRVQHVLDGRVAARHGVPHHDPVGRRLEVFRPVPLPHRDARPLQHRAHGRVEAVVGAFHLVPQLARDAGEGGHEGSTDPEDVEAHGPGGIAQGSPNSWWMARVESQNSAIESPIPAGRRTDSAWRRMWPPTTQLQTRKASHGMARTTPAPGLAPSGSPASSSATRGRATASSTAPVPARAAQVW